jgi:hypothetical protein
MAVGMKDPVLGAPAMKYLREQIRNCPPPMELAEGGHFVPECGAEIARRALEVFALTRFTSRSSDACFFGEALEQAPCKNPLRPR